MSEPKRYSIVADYQAPWAKMHEFNAGGWVKWEDYARLKAEVERLKKFNEEAMAHIAKEERKSRERLDIVQADVERLSKAGDGLYKSMLEIGCNEMADNFQYDAWWGSMKDWNAAKEGNGQS